MRRSPYLGYVNADLALSFGHRDSLGDIAKSYTSESSNLQLHYLQPKIVTMQFLQPASYIFLSFQGQGNCLPQYKTRCMGLESTLHAWQLFSILFTPLPSSITSLQSCSSKRNYFGPYCRSCCSSSRAIM
jgi:hypothetical protein